MTEQVAIQDPDVDVLETKVRDIIAAELEIEPEELRPTADFVDEYDADSLSLITVLARMEKELGIRVPTEARAELVNLDRVLEAARAAAGCRGV